MVDLIYILGNKGLGKKTVTNQQPKYPPKWYNRRCRMRFPTGLTICELINVGPFEKYETTLTKLFPNEMANKIRRFAIEKKLRKIYQE